MNVSPFKQFLSSLSQISRWHFEVWHADRTVFSSNANRSKLPICRDIREIAIKAISNGTFQYACPQGNYELFGTPIKNGEKVIGALISYAQICAKESEIVGIVSPKNSHAEKMEEFLIAY